MALVTEVTLLMDIKGILSDTMFEVNTTIQRPNNTTIYPINSAFNIATNTAQVFAFPYKDRMIEINEITITNSCQGATLITPTLWLSESNTAIQFGDQVLPNSLSSINLLKLMYPVYFPIVKKIGGIGTNFNSIVMDNLKIKMKTDATFGYIFFMILSSTVYTPDALENINVNIKGIYL
jgi:hypothetical protein